MITIIVPVYNVEKYLYKCIKSLVEQTYNNLEIILIDDGSIDSSVGICDEWEKKDNRITVIHKANGGLSSARNLGLDKANGEYICFIDSDDWVEKDFIELLFKLLQNYNADISQIGFVKEEIDKESVAHRSESTVLITGKEAIKNLSDKDLYLNTVIMCNKLYKRKIFQELRFDEGFINEDEAIIHEILYKADKIIINKSKLYHYLTRPNSIVNSKFSIKNLDAIYAYEKRLSFLKNNGENELVEMTMRMYFRVLLGLSSDIFYSSLDNKENFLVEIIDKMDSIMKKLVGNKYLDGIDRTLLSSYKLNKNLGFYMNKNLKVSKKILRKFKMKFI